MFKVTFESVNPVIPALKPKSGETFMVFRVEGGTEETIHKAGRLFQALSSSLSDGKFELHEAGQVVAALIGEGSLESRLITVLLAELGAALKDGKITSSEAMAALFKLYAALK